MQAEPVHPAEIDMAQGGEEQHQADGDSRHQDASGTQVGSGRPPAATRTGGECHAQASSSSGTVGASWAGHQVTDFQVPGDLSGRGRRSAPATGRR